MGPGDLVVLLDVPLQLIRPVDTNEPDPRAHVAGRSSEGAESRRVEVKGAVNRTALFHRDFRGFTGGHLKVWNYFNHVERATGWRAAIHFSPDSVWDLGNPWQERRSEILPVWEPERADLLFLGGYDWRMIPAVERAHYCKPVINLIQHVHHADPAHPLSEFLSHRSVRICVSEEVRDAIVGTGRVNGPTVVIPNGIDFADLPPTVPTAVRPVDWLICGLKEDRSTIARALTRRLKAEGGWGRVEALTKPLPRAEFLRKLGDAHAVVLLPRATEGFYLPALEAMALGTWVVCPDCVGNRSFCRDGENAVVPRSWELEDLLAAMRTVRDDPRRADRMAESGRRTAAGHTLAREQAAFGELLAGLDALW